MDLGWKNEVLLLTKEQIRSILTMEDTIKVVEEGFKAFNSGKMAIPFPVSLKIQENRGEVHHAVEDGTISVESIHAELGEVLFRAEEWKRK